MITSIVVKGQAIVPADTMATAETRFLYNSMHKMAQTAVMFGHHDDTAYGINWRLAADSSDVKKVTGSYPAVYGWDLAGIEQDSTHDINGIPFTKQAELVRQAYERGGINTFCWHMSNPVTGKTAWDTTNITIGQLLPGGSHHQIFLSYLDKAAQYLNKLKGSNGEPIPIIFRPYHELTGDWFWWGTHNGSVDQFTDLWRFTINYLRNNKKLHNLLVVYSLNTVYTESEALECYPGDGYVDLIGFDTYCTDSIKTYKEDLSRQLNIMNQIAIDHHKLSCIAETGYQGIPLANWWTDVLLPALPGHITLSYLLIWRNNGLEHFYIPYPSQISATDFKNFYLTPAVVFQDKLTPEWIYGPMHYSKYYLKKP